MILDTRITETVVSGVNSEEATSRNFASVTYVLMNGWDPFMRAQMCI